MIRKGAIGIDVGGTAIKAGVVTVDRAVALRREIETAVNEGVAPVVGRIAGLVQSLADEAAAQNIRVDVVGLGMPGTLSHRHGVVIAPPNLPGWSHVPIVRLVHEATGLPVALDNDANNAALGEYHCGAGRGVSDMVLLTLGTGVGSGLIFGGKLFRGAWENAGEWGHTIIEIGGRRCGCGQLGCLEAYASATATVQRALERIETGRPTCLTEIVSQGKAISSKDIFEAAQAGDDLAAEVWQDTCRYLAVACINIQRSCNPQRIVLSGGMSAAGQGLLAPLVREIDTMSSKAFEPAAEIRIAELGNDAGFIGAAMNALEGD